MIKRPVIRVVSYRGIFMKKRDIVKSIGILVFIIVAVVSFLKNTDLFKNNAPVGAVDTENAAVIDFINCGQGDSTLLISEGQVTLIDATTGENQEQVIVHLQNRGIQKIQHLVLTHPHEDHIGGAKAVLETFDVENIYMKRPTAGTEPTSKVYLNLLQTMQKQQKTIHSVKIGDSFTCGQFVFTVLGPLEEYEDLNNQSIVLRGEYGDCSFLFTGDMEADAEKDLVEQYGNTLHSTVLKVGHHGSSTSTCKEFLGAVDPQFGIISCGAENSYGHPHAETLELLTQNQVEYYRTDTMGTITAYTDGKSIEWKEAA